MTRATRHLHWDACYNVRDLGGLPTEDDHAIRWEALVRSDILSRLTTSGKQALIDHGVRTIIDLRGPEQVQDEASAFMQPNQANSPTYLNLPLEHRDQEVDAKMDQAESKDKLYCILLDHFKSSVATILRAIANADEGGILVHCHAGKDRTGLIVALLLRLAGVSETEIAEDYALSEDALWPLYRILEAEAVGDPIKTADLQYKIPTSPPEVMLNVLAHLERTYGGVHGYLLNAGLNAQELEAIRSRLR